MKKLFLVSVLLFINITLYAQVGGYDEFEENDDFFENTEPEDDEGKFTNRTGQEEKPSITEYKIINFRNDTTYVDTTLSILKDYKFNYLRTDDFGLQPINNVGQAHISLLSIEEPSHLLPLFGARSRHFNYLEVEDIDYYYVPTPLTELYFRTTFEQGQQLDALFTISTSPQLNLMIAYKGIRSLGKYRHALTATGNFRTSANYHTKNRRYQLKAHFVAQNLLNEENGGLSPRGLNQYLSNTEEFGDPKDANDRRVLEVNFEDAESTLKGKRFYLDHQYAILKNTDTTSGLNIGHQLDITDKSFEYNQVSPSELFGDSYISKAINNRVALEGFSNQLYVNFKNKWLGSITANVGAFNINYGYNTILTKIDIEGNETRIINRIKGDVFSIGAKFNKEYKGFDINADGKSIIVGDFGGNYINASAGYVLKEKYELRFKIQSSSVAPNYNFLLHQSDYVGYNWQNINRKEESSNFKNIQTQKVTANLKLADLFHVETSFTTINNHAYFTKDKDSITVPRQFEGNINLLKVKLTQRLKFNWFGIDNTIAYQNVVEGDQIYRVPQIVTRNTIYYQDKWFKKALFLQTGVTFKYYSEYNVDGYDPILSEFYTQSPEEIAFFNQRETAQTFGGFPQIDLFFNTKIKQTRIFFKVENFTEAFMQNNEFSAPGYAPRDAVLRFGIVWNFFL